MLKSYASEMVDVLARFANLKENEWMMQHITLDHATDAHNRKSNANEYLHAAQINLQLDHFLYSHFAILKFRFILTRIYCISMHFFMIFGVYCWSIFLTF